MGGLQRYVLTAWNIIDYTNYSIRKNEILEEDCESEGVKCRQTGSTGGF